MLYSEHFNLVSPSGKEIAQIPELKINTGLTLLIGPNGSGKTTLLKHLAGLTPKSCEQVYLCFQERLLKLEILPLLDKAKVISWYTLPSPSEFSGTVLDYLLMGRFPHHLGRIHKKDKDAVEKTAYLFQIDSLLNTDLNQLSSGQLAKCGIAKAWAQETPILFFDEPLAYLDLGIQIQMLEQLNFLARTENKCIIMSVHNLHLIYPPFSFQHLWVISDRKLIHGLPQTVWTRPIVEDNFDFKAPKNLIFNH